MLFETYYGCRSLLNLETGETLEQTDPNETKGSFKTLLEMTQNLEADQIIQKLRSDDLVDNITVHYKGDFGPKSSWMLIAYHQYSEGEKPNYSEPNRLYVFAIESESEIIRIHEEYGGNVDLYTQAVYDGRE